MGTTSYDDALTVKDDGKKFARIPVSEGPHAALCCDVIDEGEHEEFYQGQSKGMVRKIRIAFLTDEEHPETHKPMLVSQRFTLSMNEKANLRKFMEQWRGKPYTVEELAAGVNPAKMIGVPALLQITHRAGTGKNEGKTFDNISSIMRLPAKMAPQAPEIGEYVRVKDRPTTDTASLVGGEPACPDCGGKMWDNRTTKSNPKAPDYKCRDRTCEGVIWPPREQRPTPQQRAVVEQVKREQPDFEEMPTALVDDDDDYLPF